MAAVPNTGRGDAEVTAEATHGLYQRYGRQIYAYCLHQLRSREEAEDAVQTTFLNAFRGLQGGTATHAEQAWLFKIAQNVCYARRSSSSRRLRLEAPNNFELLQDLIPSPRQNGDVELIGLEDALEAMPENQRRAILLREWQGLSYREIAEELELSQASVEMLIFRARRALASALEPDAPKKQRNAGRGLSIASLLAVIKSLFTGGAAVKAVAVAVAATVTAVATEAEHTIVHAVAAPRTAQSAPSLAAPSASRTAAARTQQRERGTVPAAGAPVADVSLQLHGGSGRAAGAGAPVVHSAPAGGRRAQPTDSPPLAPEQPPAPAPAPAAPTAQDAPQATPTPTPAAPPPAPSATEAPKAAPPASSPSPQAGGSALSTPTAPPKNSAANGSAAGTGAGNQATLTVVAAPSTPAGANANNDKNTGGKGEDRHRQKDRAKGDDGRIATTPAPTTTTQPVSPALTLAATTPAPQTVPQPVSPAITTTTSPPATSGSSKDKWSGNAPVATTPVAPTPIPPAPPAVSQTTTTPAPPAASPTSAAPQPSDKHGRGRDDGGGRGKDK